MTAPVRAADPTLVLRYQRDHFGLLIVKTCLRRLDGTIECISTTRRVDIKSMGVSVLPTERVVGAVCMGALRGHRATPTGVYLKPEGTRKGSG